MKYTVFMFIFFSNISFALDLGGVELDQKIETIKESLGKNDPALKLKAINFSGGIIGYEGESKTKGRSGYSTSNNIIALADEKTLKVWYLGRKVILAEGEELDKKTFYKTIIEKYGKPSRSGGAPETRNLDQLTWNYFRNGSQYFGEFKSGPCHYTRANGITDNSFFLQSREFQIPKNFSQECKNQIYVEAVNNRDGLISEYYIFVISEANRYDSVSSRKNAEEQERLNKIEELKNRAEKPKL